MVSKLVSRFSIFLLCWILIIFSFRPLFTPYIYGSADGLAHKFRLVSFMQSLKEGNIRPRWAGDQALGFGAPVFLLNYSLPYYIVSGFVFLGFSIRTATYFFMGSSLLFSFTFMFLLMRKLNGKFAAVVSATIYLLAPYHLLVVYLYEGWGEMTAFIFPPLILYLTIKSQPKADRPLAEKAKSIYFFPLVFSWAGLFLSHNVSALLFTPIILLTSFILLRNHGKCWAKSFFGCIVAVLLTAFFWLPSIVLSSFTTYPELIAREYQNRFLYYKSIASHLMIAIATVQKGTTTYSDFTIGLPFLAIVIFGLLFVLVNLVKKRQSNYAFLLLLIAFLLGGVIMASSWSDEIWKLLPILSVIVYPFRFLFPAIFAGSILTGYLSGKNKIIATVLFVLTIISAFPFTRPWLDVFDFQNSYFTSPQIISTAPLTMKNMGTAEFLPRWVSKSYLQKMEEQYVNSHKLPAKFELDIEDGEILSQKVKEEEITANLNLKRDMNLTVNLFYFPNWEAYVDGNSVSVFKDINGRVVVPMDKGTHTLRLVFGVSNVEKVGWGMTGISIIFITVIIIITIIRIKGQAFRAFKA